MINGRDIALHPAARSEGDSTWVPVLAFAPLIGIEPLERDGRLALRWNGGCGELADAESREISSVAYASLDGLVSRVGGSIRRAGDDVIVDVPVAQLTELVAGGEELTVRLDRFAPTLVTRSNGVDVVRFVNCRTDVAETTVVFGPGDVGRATLVATDGSTCEVRRRVPRRGCVGRATGRDRRRLLRDPRPLRGVVDRLHDGARQRTFASSRVTLPSVRRRRR